MENVRLESDNMLVLLSDGAQVIVARNRIDGRHTLTVINGDLVAIGRGGVTGAGWVCAIVDGRLLCEKSQ